LKSTSTKHHKYKWKNRKFINTRVHESHATHSFWFLHTPLWFVSVSMLFA
jgi:hypothetical protein